jgi:hypothetical protein
MTDKLPPNQDLLLKGPPTPAEVKRMVRDRSRSLMWEAQQLSKAGEHELAASVTKAASQLETGLEAEAKATLKSAARGARKAGRLGTAERLEAKRNFEREQAENPTL